MIRRYARLRGKHQLGVNEKTLRIAYQNANEKQRALYKKEMREYFDSLNTAQDEQGQNTGTNT